MQNRKRLLVSGGIALPTSILVAGLWICTGGISQATIQANMHSVSEGFFTVRAATTKQARSTINLVASEFKRVKSLLPLNTQKVDRPVIISLWQNTAELEANTNMPVEHAGGIFNPDKTRFSIDLVYVSDTQFRKIISHELCHILLHHFVEEGSPGNRNPLPLAINEGLATYCESSQDYDRIILAGRAFDSNMHIPLDRLLQIYKYSDIIPGEIALFYAESYSFTHFLSDRLTPTQWSSILLEMRDGKDFISSLRRALLLSETSGLTEAIEKAWKTYAIFQKDITECIVK